jgi:hypothetical protein
MTQLLVCSHATFASGDALGATQQFLNGSAMEYIHHMLYICHMFHGNEVLCSVLGHLVDLGIQLG